jgi:hypothetical protein
MIQRFSPQPGSLNTDIQQFFDMILPDKLIQAFGAQSTVKIAILGLQDGVVYSF